MPRVYAGRSRVEPFDQFWKNFMQDLTRCVHHPVVSTEGYASLVVPTHRASTIVSPDAAAFAARAQRGFDGYTYGLHGTPTSRTLEAQLTALHDGARTVLVPSGLAPRCGSN